MCIRDSMNHVQILCLLVFIDLSWSPDIISVISVLDFVSLMAPGLISIDCFLESVMEYRVVIESIVTSFGPMILFAFINLIVTILNSRGRWNYDISRRTLFFILLTTFHSFLAPTVLRQSLKTILCMPFDENLSDTVLRYAPSSTCWSTGHAILSIICLLSGFGVWGPLACFYFFRRNRLLAVPKRAQMALIKHMTMIEKKAVPKDEVVGDDDFAAMKAAIIKEKKEEAIQEAEDSKEEKAQLRLDLIFIWGGYTDQRLQWEFVWLTLKVALIFIATISPHVSYEWRGALSLLVTVVGIKLHFHAWPFISHFINSLQLASLLVPVSYTHLTLPTIYSV
eukprot:TRINITY_DN11705_c0_g1_i2.p1 TRINITY_DN11705_c0_g1~~TRINITY_DN11705_c0_g1_i2.p1  ORF type:complete len:358 (+),score=80.81 TRINITY_DN11705_c0_g1_i2:61-1074(+)